MTASELIKALEEAIEAHGDLKVICEYAVPIAAVCLIEKDENFPGSPLFNLSS